MAFGAGTWILGKSKGAVWGFILTVTALAASLAVNTVVTGLIIFKILKVFLEVNAASTSVERTLGSTRANFGISYS